jgi:hypothetical protein
MIMTLRFPYPNEHHQYADETAERRALTAIRQIEADVLSIKARIENGTIEGDDTRRLLQAAHALTVHAQELETLRGVREWDRQAKRGENT